MKRNETVWIARKISCSSLWGSKGVKIHST